LGEVLTTPHLKKYCYESFTQYLRDRDHFEDPGIDGKIILRWIFRKWDVGVWTGSCWHRIETGGRQL